jgi:hypothetical protein
MVSVKEVRTQKQMPRSADKNASKEGQQMKTYEIKLNKQRAKLFILNGRVKIANYVDINGTIHSVEVDEKNAKELVKFADRLIKVYGAFNSFAPSVYSWFNVE